MLTSYTGTPCDCPGPPLNCCLCCWMKSCSCIPSSANCWYMFYPPRLNQLTACPLFCGVRPATPGLNSPSSNDLATIMYAQYQDQKQPTITMEVRNYRIPMQIWVFDTFSSSVMQAAVIVPEPGIRILMIHAKIAMGLLNLGILCLHFCQTKSSS